MVKLTNLPPEIVIKIIEYHVEGLGVSLFGNKLLILESIQSALLWERICKAFSNESLIRNYLTDNFWIKIILENFVRETIGLDSSLKSTPRRKIIEHIKSKQDVKTLLVNYREFLNLITDFPHSISIYQRYFTRKDALETFQIVVLGHHQAGKSQLVNSFLQIETNQTSHHNEVHTRVEKHPMTPNQMFRMQIMDTHFLHTCSQHISQAHAILLVCSHCQLEETLFETEQILKQCIEIKQSSTFPLIVALNKSDETRRKSFKKRRSNNESNNNTSPSTPKSPTSNYHGSSYLDNPFLASPPQHFMSSGSSSPSLFNSPPPVCCFSAPQITTGNNLLLGNNSYNNNSHALIMMNTSSATISTTGTTAMSTSSANISTSYNGTPSLLFPSSSSSTTACSLSSLFIQNNNNVQPNSVVGSSCCVHHHHQQQHVRTEEDEYNMMENLLIRYGMINYKIIRTSGKLRSNVAEAFDECVLRASLNHAKLLSDVMDAAVIHRFEVTEKFFGKQRKRCDLL